MMDLHIDLIPTPGVDPKYEVDGEVTIITGLRPIQTKVLTKSEAAAGFVLDMIMVNNVDAVASMITYLQMKDATAGEAWLVFNDQNEVGVMIVKN